MATRMHKKQSPIVGEPAAKEERSCKRKTAATNVTSESPDINDAAPSIGAAIKSSDVCADEPTQEDYDRLDALRREIDRLKNNRKNLMKTDPKHRGLAPDHPDVLKRDKAIQDKNRERDILYTKIGRRPTAFTHHEDATTEMHALDAAIDSDCGKLATKLKRKHSLGHELADVFEQRRQERDAAGNRDDDNSSRASTDPPRATENAASSLAQQSLLLDLRKELQSLENKRHGIKRRMEASQNKKLKQDELQELETLIDEKRKEKPMCITAWAGKPVRSCSIPMQNMISTRIVQRCTGQCKTYRNVTATPNTSKR